MRRILIPVIAVLLLLPAVNNAFAQDDDEEVWLRSPLKFALSAELGIGMPLGPEAFNDLWNSSFPLTIAFGYAIIPYIEVKGWATYTSWGISSIPAKEAIGYPGVTTINGGGITVVMYGASAKVIAFPNSRMTPYIEIGGGAYQVTADDLTVSRDGEPVISNSMEGSNGGLITGAFGMQHGVNLRWTAYTEFNYYYGLSDTFAPGNLLLRNENSPEVEGERLQIGSIVLGIALGF